MWFAGMLINFRPGKSGTPAWPFLAKVMPKFSVNPRSMSPNTLCIMYRAGQNDFHVRKYGG
jgi:hypothetical protein